MRSASAATIRRTESLWSKNFILICFAALFPNIATQMMSSTMTLYVDHLGGTASFSGFLVAAYTCAAMLARLFCGYLVDHKGRHNVLIAGAIIYAVATIGFLLLPNLAFLPVLRFLHGIGFAAISTAATVAAVDALPANRLGEGIGYYGLASSLATAIGPSLGLTLIAGANYPRLYGSTTGVILIAALLFHHCHFQQVQDTPPAVEDTQTAGLKKHFSLWNILEKSVLVPAILEMLVMLSQCCIFVFLTLYASHKGLTNTGLFFTVAALGMIASRLKIGQLVDRKGPLVVLIPGMLCGIACYALVCLMNSTALLALAGLLYGFFAGITYATFNAIVMSRATAQRRGAATATYMLLVDLGFGAGGLIWGLVIDHFGFLSMYIASIICLSITTIATFLYLRKRQPARQSKPVNLPEPNTGLHYAQRQVS